MKLVIELPPREELLKQNRLRWAQVVADPALADLPFKVETNQPGTAKRKHLFRFPLRP